MARGGIRKNFTPRPSHWAVSHAAVPTVSKVPAKNEPCMIFTRTGRCGQRKKCPYQHEPSRVALCQQFLKMGRCTKSGGERCFLSHTPRAENSPLCVYYARGNCTNQSCPYTHMDQLGSDPNDAPVCRSFALNGWCDRGAKCNKRHCFDCPDFDAHGSCANPVCKLEHTIRDTTKLTATNAHITSTTNTTTQNGKNNSIPTFKPNRDMLNNPRSINLETFIAFLRTASRQSFDAAMHETENTRPELESEDQSSSSEESDDEDSDLGWADIAEHASDDVLDANADFIKV